ncbi:hypothetical protein SAMN05660772_02432 [Pasteurella testudinis DSM 23072]|uniref:Uncharacterized protein n=1 Tax=Pasteurella testudinis DSM 23072 TaxID=1122938 RepID=A0A1W1UVR5_9PAST|nr:hypothetical protein [Pasteurella testudinis]SMB85126.1 hypothetical protein SAMN05660772_02432 [Pasteurella testudinis DSM 23072]SUB52121.1 Uncharacterised protein [Pasteurella testudinis]
MIDKTTEMELTNLPDMQIDFDGPFLASCPLPNGQLLLDICHDYFRDWFEHQYSVHAFANTVAKDGVSLWTANQANTLLPEEELSKGAFSFYLSFDQMHEAFDSIVMVQCHVTQRNRLQ